MIIKALGKYLRISAFKVRPVVKLVKGKNVNAALPILKMTSKKGAGLIYKVLNSAIANAKNRGYDESKLFIANIKVNEGPTFKRFRSASFGRAVKIRKRTAHILVELDTPEQLVEKNKKKEVKK